MRLAPRVSQKKQAKEGLNKRNKEHDKILKINSIARMKYNVFNVKDSNLNSRGPSYALLVLHLCKGSWLMVDGNGGGKATKARFIKLGSSFFFDLFLIGFLRLG